MDVTFVKGTFLEYRATIKVHLGQYQRDIFEDDIVEYDGSILIHNDERFSLPTLRSAVKKGWLVPAEDKESVYVPQTAGVEVRPAQDTGSKEKLKIETVDDEERVVGTLSGAAIGGRPQMSIGGQETGEVVAKVSSPAKQKATIKDAGSAAARIKSLDNKTRVATPSKAKPKKPAAKTKRKAAKKPAKKKERPSSVDLGGGAQWSLEGHWRERVKRAKTEFGEDPSMLRKIQAAETAQGVKSALEKVIVRLET